MQLTDSVIGRLEELNLAERGGRRPDPTTQRLIDSALAELPPEACRRYGTRVTVQQALDGFFDVQEELMLPWQQAQWSAA